MIDWIQWNLNDEFDKFEWWIESTSLLQVEHEEVPVEAEPGQDEVKTEPEAEAEADVPPRLETAKVFLIIFLSVKKYVQYLALYSDNI